MKREEADKLLHEKVEAGELVSPVLPGGVKNYLIDIDGTITEDVPNEEPERMGKWHLSTRYFKSSGPPLRCAAAKKFVTWYPKQA